VEEDFQLKEVAHSSGSAMELDVYIEALKLGAEYQGEQHYRPVYWMNKDFATQLTRDEEKRRACKQVHPILY